ncbi:biotin transporter BioY [Sporomusa acidovorans]|uniref:Biotin transporter n=1 Tax=Sporomusa acidovorans (strain ATCC 49682 / DSM 3132 / Mol) TaxID=1123286 RepID=A0ABZ3IWW0_SPOA4|nr:biotin transporter BioY [Sporomusa acidovorans]OZC23699.1 biotin transporter BioY [Sporomusa acidovorans DSM 3132]SDE25572.1 biotin transport system substrate-specific component [Sporomusa acidovorans]
MNIRDMALTSLFAALLAVSAQISFPLGPVPVTLQILFILLAGMVLGRRLGPASVAIWVLLGVFGLPVFAQGKAGAAVLIGPTGGYILGYFICTYIVGYVAENFRLTYKATTIAMFAGLAAIYGLGLAGFMLSFHYVLHKAITLDQALNLAVLPFLPLDFFKMLIAVYGGVRIRRALVKAGLLATEQLHSN